MIAEKYWRWFGSVGHCIVGRWCRFHLTTVVGEYFISTIGEYVHPSRSGGSEATEAKYLKKHPLGDEIGCGRLFETCVFRVGTDCDSDNCDCGCPFPGDWSELVSFSANTRREANQNHMKACYLAANDSIEVGEEI